MGMRQLFRRVTPAFVEDIARKFAIRKGLLLPDGSLPMPGGGENSVPDFDTYLQEVYELNDNGPDTLVGAKNGYNLTRQAGTPSFNVTGIHGDCIQHDATSYFTRAFGSGFGFGAEDFLISTWFDITTVAANKIPMSVAVDPTIDSSNSLKYVLFSSLGGAAAGQFNFSLLNGSSVPFTKPGWHNAIICRLNESPSDRFYIFLDGICIGTATTGAAVDFSSYQFVLGRAGANQADTMKQDQTRVYQRSGGALFADRAELARFALDMWNGGAGFFTWS